MFQCGHHHNQGFPLVTAVCLAMHLLLVIVIEPTIAEIPIFWNNLIYHYSLTPTVFDNANDVAHLVSTNFT
jgi:hypothetical protein